jgi:23S rRNA (pseudouridine1915-N3)-methyltransferase
VRLRLIAVGSRMPKWVEEGWHEYAKRLPAELALELVEIPLNTRGKNADVARFIRQEGEAMLARSGLGTHCHPRGPWQALEHRATGHRAGPLAPGCAHGEFDGRWPEGLAPEVCARAEQRWSLSPLTLPHPLVRILIGEQLYRAWTVLSGTLTTNSL